MLKKVFICCSLSLLTLATYYRSLWYGFIFDDLPTINENYFVKYASLSELFFKHSRWLSCTVNNITYKFYQLDPFAYRIIGILIHIFIGILIFTGLTAYDVQRIKVLGSELLNKGEEERKIALMCALTLYLDFINLFLHLLNFLGKKK